MMRITNLDLRRTELGLLLTLDALIETRGVTATARRLGLSQPAISAQLDKLRRLLDDKILVGNAHGMVPTPLALDIHEELRHHLRGLESLVGRSRPFDPATSERVFRVLVTDYTLSVLLVPFCAALAQQAPRVRLAMEPFAGRVAGQHLEQDADLAVTSENMTDPGLPARFLFSERFLFACRKGGASTERGFNLDRFCNLKHVLVSPSGGGFVGLVDEILAKRDLKRHVAVSVPYFSSAVELISTSDLCGVLPARIVVAANDRLHHVPPPVPLPEFSVFASWHARHATDPGHVWLRRALADFCAKGNGRET